MLAQAMAELMPVEQLQDVLVYPNPNNENQPLAKIVRTYPDYKYLSKYPEYNKLYSAQEIMYIKKYTEENKHEKLVGIQKVGLGRRIVNIRKMMLKPTRGFPVGTLLLAIGLLLVAVVFFVEIEENIKWMIIAAVLGLGFLYVLSNATAGLNRRLMPTESTNPKLIVDNTHKKTAPFIDATGSRAGSLLGDVRHDPLQSGGLGTPAHLRVEAGAIQRANQGVLFIDEIASLKLNWQQELLTAMQEKKYTITGQSEMSSGAMVKTQPIPTDFVLVAAGNLPDMQQIHPALRSRIRGGGYEIYVEDTMEDNAENENRLVVFVAQEVNKDKKIPHFEREAVAEIIEEAKRMAGRKKRFTLNLRELGGLVRAAGDIAKGNKRKTVKLEDVFEAKKIFNPIESQLGKKMIERKKEYQTIETSGSHVGRVNGLAVIGETSGLVLPIVAEVTPAASKEEGKVIATGKLGQIAKEAVDNVSAVVKKTIGTDISQKDIHIQFLQTYEGLEGDSASISVAIAVLSAMTNIPVKQDIGMTGSLDVRGEVLPVGGVTAKVEAAVETGLKKVIVPKSNAEDIYLSKEKRKKIEIIKAENIIQVLEHALKNSEKKRKLIGKMKKEMD